jgi:hypothetical protein
MVFLALLLLSACAMPVIAFSVRRKGALLAIFAMEFAAYYAIPILMLHRVRIGAFPGRDLPHPLVRMALELALVAFAGVCFGYFLIPENGSLIPRFKMAWSNPGVIRVAAIAMCFVGLAATVLFNIHRQSSEPSQFVAFAADLAMYGITLLFTLQLVKRLNPLYLVALWGVLVPARLLVGLSSGATAQVLGVGLTLLVLYSEIRGRLWWSAILAGAIGVAVLRPLMSPFRGLTWHGGAASGVSTVQKLKIFSGVAEGAAEGRFGNYDTLIQFAATRLCVTCTFADVLRQTPNIVPYWDGATYYPILFKPIPRLLWPGKPIDLTGQEFGHRYGYLALDDHDTSYNLPQTVELYANFGVIGVVIGSLLFGIFYRAAELMFFHSRSGVGAVALGAVVLSKLLEIESGASLVLGGLVWGLVVVGLVNFAVYGAEFLSDATVTPPAAALPRR